MLQDLSQEGHVGPAEIEALRSRLKEVEEMMTAANDRGAREQAISRLKSCCGKWKAS